MTSKNLVDKWLPTPTFLYRNYLYRQIVKDLPKKSYFLDVGAGNGVFIKNLIKLGFSGETLDISVKAVDFARKILAGEKFIQVQQGDIFTYKPTKKYDAIFCFEVLEHIKEDKLALKKIYDLIKPGGVFVMSVPAHMSHWSEIDEVKGHYRRYEKKELTAKIEQAGFRITSFLSFGFPFLSLIRLFSKSGKYVHSTTQNYSKDIRGQESSIQQEYHPILKKMIANTILLTPLFKIMNIFLKTDLGFGYIVVAKRLK